MNQTAPVPALAQESYAPEAVASPSYPAEKGRGHGMSFIFWLLEQSKLTLFLIPTVFAAVVTIMARGGWELFVASWLAVPVFGIVVPLLALIWRSWQHQSATGNWEPHLTFRDPAEAAKWKGKRIPMEILYEAYMAEKVDFKGDVLDALMNRNGWARFAFTWGDAKFYFNQFLRQNVTHSLESDRGDIAPVYDRGNDFYNWFLGPTMTYTSGMFRSENDTLEEAQERKLETVCQYVQMKPGDRHLDIGCGWGPLITHAAKHHGTQSTGITLAKEQAEWARKRAADNGVADRVHVIVDDYRNLPKQKWDKITCLEMAEHVGIKNFQKFLGQVRGMLEDDGVFYLQIAGLRRPWQYEDLVWGLFMAKYIFPGADASCPLGFVVNQVERAGFEVHRVENCGVHYGLTIRRWYENWERNRDAVIAKYGQRWFRMWQIFLGWSVIIAGQGSSTVFMITLTKNLKNDKRTVGAGESVPLSRQDRWVGPKPVATQQ